MSKRTNRIGLLVATGLVATMLPFGAASATQNSTVAQAAPSVPDLLGTPPTVARAELLKPTSMTARERLVSFRADSLTSRRVGQRVAFNMFDDAKVVGLVDHRQTHDQYTEWSGTLEGVDLGTWVATQTGDYFMLTVTSPEGAYEVRPATSAGSAYRVSELRQEMGDEGHLDSVPSGSLKAAPEAKGGDADKMPYKLEPSARLKPAPTKFGRNTPQVLQRKDSASVFDIALVWSPQAAATFGGDAVMTSAAAQVIALSNQIYANSGVKTSMRLMGYGNTGVNEVGDFSSDLNKITKGKGGYRNVRKYANRQHVDAVGLLIAGTADPSLCGVAWLNDKRRLKTKRNMTSVTNPACISYYTVTHETGHNQGASHDRYVDRNDYYKYGHGYVNVAGGWRTVMAYPTECLAAGISNGCVRVGYMSNPRALVAGSAAGNRRANNTRVLNKSRKWVAQIEQSQIYGKKVKIKGKVKAKKKVRAKTKARKWTPGRVKIKWQWFIDGVPVAGKKGKRSKLKLIKAWKGHTVTVAATGKSRGYTPVVVYSKTRTIK